MSGKHLGADTTLRFLYTVLKQLDMKNVDWNLVATDMEISNGAAARMRWVRFKQLMEGAPRGKPNADTNRVAKPKPKARTKAKPKGKTGVKGEDSEEEEEEEITKEEEE